MYKISFAAILPAAAIAAILSLAQPMKGLGATANVSVINDSFSPSSTSINAGDTVLWTWGSGSEDHNVTSTSNPKAWAWTASLTTSAPFSFSQTFGTAGTFPYECTIHASIGMVGSVTVAAAANVPPTIAITNPASGTIFRAPASFTIQTTNFDSDATVTSVQFFNGSTSLATVTSAPFNTAVNNLAAGNYTFQAIATDSVGLKNTNAVSVIVDTPPTVTIISPASGSVLSAPANVNIQASASSSGGTISSVQFLVGSTVVSNRTVSPYVASTNNLAAGSYTLSAIAADNHGITATNSVAISVVTPVPTTFSAVQHSGGSFQFSYAANTGLQYIVQGSTNLVTGVWVPVVTNQASGNSVIFTDAQATNGQKYYRVERLPNP